MKYSSFFLAGSFLSLALLSVGCSDGGDDTDGTGGAASGGASTGGASSGGGVGGEGPTDTGGGSAFNPCELEEVLCGGVCLAVGESSEDCDYVYRTPNFYSGSPLKFANGVIYLGTPELHSMRIDGSSLARLSEMAPESIALGTDVIYAIGWLRSRLPTRSLYRVPLAGGSPTSLGDSYSFAKDLTLVGERLYFRRTSGTGAGLDHEIVSVNLSGDDEIVHTPMSVRSNFAASDAYLYFYNREEVDGESLHSISRTPLLAPGVETVVPGAQGRALAWSEGNLYYINNGLYAYDEESGTNTQLRTPAEFGAYPTIGLIHEGNYIGIGGSNLVVPLDGSPRIFLPDADATGSDAFIEDGKVYFFGLSNLVALVLP